MESGLLAAAKVSGLFIYPIKSCRGISVSHAPLTPTGNSSFCLNHYVHNFTNIIHITFLCFVTGLRWDRQWVVVNSQGRACTQRVDPKLALVEVQLPPDALLEDFQPTNNSYMGNLFTLHIMIFLFFICFKLHGLACPWHVSFKR